MRTQVQDYNNLILKFNQYSRKLQRLETVGTNFQRQLILKKRILKLKKQIQRAYALLTKKKQLSITVGAFLLGLAIGQAQMPTYKLLEVDGSAANPFEGLTDVGAYSAVALGDLDGDGDLDLLAGDFYGNFHYFENLDINGEDNTIDFAHFGTPVTIDDLSAGNYLSTPCLVDLDGDGDLDLLSGSSATRFYYFENTDISGSDITLDGASFVASDLNGSFEEYRQYTSCALTDLDGDGDIDLLEGEFGGGFFYYSNEGNATAASFPENEVLTTLNDVDASVGNSSFPAFADLDADGDQDLLSGDALGEYYYFKNIGDYTAPLFDNRVDMFFNGLESTSNITTPVFGDLDGDGDLDLFSGGIDGNFYYYENVDQDLDNDGILDIREVTFWENGQNVTYDIWGDEDGDGILNYRDVIDDGDGDGSNTNYTDSNNDRIADIFDTDGDGKPNYVDLDSDNDGIPDVIEAQTTEDFIAPSRSYGAENGVDIAFSDRLTPVDTDSDNIPDFLDTDTDNDSTPDAVESGIELHGSYFDNGLDTALDFDTYASSSAGKFPYHYSSTGGVVTEADYRNSDVRLTVSPSVKTTTVALLTNLVRTNFEVVGLTTEASIKIFDSRGSLVQIEDNYQSGTIAIDLEMGIYFVYVEEKTTVSKFTLVVVE